jgi:thiopurine S-methyltransferase
MKILDKEYWSDRYRKEETGWDASTITTPLREYIDQLTDKTVRVLIPGAGNAHEAEYMFRKGFKNVFVLDFAEQPLRHFQSRLPDFPSAQLIAEDFFSHHGEYDIILEQTFFCALAPHFRPSYVKKMHSLLSPAGRLTGLLFEGTFDKEGPPFGGSVEEYQKYFGPWFRGKFEACYNSIPPRKGRELFMIMRPREREL